MNKFLETERLYLRHFTLNDFENLYALDSDPEVMKYIKVIGPDYREKLFAAMPRILAQYDRTPGFGTWALIEKSSNSFVGWHLLKELENSGEIEIGYRLNQRFWGKGYATEMAREVLRYGFETTNLDRIVAITHLENHASKRVVEKIGLRYEKNAFHYGHEVNYFALEKPQINMD